MAHSGKIGFLKPHRFTLRKWRSSIISCISCASFIILAMGCATLARQELAAGTDLQRDRITDVGVTFAEGRLWDRAVKSWNQELARNPNHAPLYYNLGVAAHQAGDEEAAATYYREALKRDPVPFFMEALAKIEGTRGIGQELVPYLLDRAGKIRTGCSFAKAGLWQEALDYWQGLSAAKNLVAIIQYNSALAWIVIGDRTKATTSLKQSIELQPAEMKSTMLAWLNGNETAPFTVPFGAVKNAQPQKNQHNAARSTPSSIAKNPAGEGFRYIITDQVPLRTQPSTESAVTYYLKFGQQVRILSTHQDWVEVTLDDGTRGWVYYRSLADTSPAL